MAKDTFSKIKKSAREVRDRIEYERIPFALIRPMFRTRMDDVDTAHKESTGVVGYIYYMDVPNAPDWRETIYGLRYPTRSTSPLGVNWINKDEQSKSIETGGKSSRSKTFRYKYAGSEQNVEDKIWALIGRNWKFTLPITVFLAGYAAMGGTLTGLQQDVENGTLDQIVQQVQETQETPANIQTQEQMPRGIRNNNPGNIRLNKIKWQGAADDQMDGEFVQFSDPVWGIRALARVLRTYQKKHNLTTITDIINRWAPPSENDSQSYVDHVSKMSGYEPFQQLDLINNDEQLMSIIQAIIAHENGIENHYDAETIMRAIEMEEPAPKHLESSDKSATIKKSWNNNFDSEKDMTYKLADAKQLVQELITPHGPDWGKIAPELKRNLQENGMPIDLMPWLNQYFLNYVSSLASGNMWWHKFSKQSI